MEYQKILSYRFQHAYILSWLAALVLVEWVRRTDLMFVYFGVSIRRLTESPGCSRQ